MQDQNNLSDTKRALFDRYLHGKITPATTIRRRSRGGSAPLSVVQEQIYLRELELQGKPPLYNECVTVRMLGPVDPDALERSFNEIIRRHEVWRTTFETKLGQPVQVVHPHVPIRFSKIDLRGFSEAQRETEAVRLVSEDTHRPFPLNSGPLLRPTLVRMSEEEHRLFLVAHQIVLDGRSAYQIYPFELSAHYKGFLTGQPSSLPELPVQCADFAWWQREWLSGREARQADYWRKQLDGNFPGFDWPMKKLNLPAKPFAGNTWPFAFSAQVSAEVRKLTKQLNTTLFLLLLTGLTTVIHRHAKSGDIVVGTLSPSGRKRDEVTDLLGYFLNPVALRLDCGVHSTFRELLCHARSVVSDAISNDDVPIEDLGQILKRQNRPGPNPFFNVAVSLQPPTPDLDLPWSVTSMDVESGGSPWPLYIAFIDRPGGIIGRVQWNPSLVEIDTIQHLLRELEETLGTTCAELAL